MLACALNKMLCVYVGVRRWWWRQRKAGDGQRGKRLVMLAHARIVFPCSRVIKHMNRVLKTSVGSVGRRAWSG
jgi:hypothetical protein